MPVLEKRRIHRSKDGILKMTPPKDWGDFFSLRGGEDLETIADAPWVVFPPQIATKADKIKRLQDIITLIKATPEPYPEARRKGKRKVKKQ